MMKSAALLLSISILLAGCGFSKMAIPDLAPTESWTHEDFDLDSVLVPPRLKLQRPDFIKANPDGFTLTPGQWRAVVAWFQEFDRYLRDLGETWKSLIEATEEHNREHRPPDDLE